MAAQNQGDLFDAYFRRADLDRDGRISGAEAVAFFQGSNLPKQVLAQIWTYADQNRIGYLGREEFYNYLKLVTVAQSKRELTPEIVRAALYTPASSKIPPPQINFAGTPASQPSAAGANRPSSQMGTLQNPGFRPPLSQPNANVNQQYSQAQLSGLVRPPNTVSGAATPLAQGVGFQGIVGDSGKTAVGGPSGVASQVSDRTVGPLPKQVGFGPGTSVPMPTLPPRPPAASGMTPSTAPTVPSKPPVPQNGFASGSVFGGDAFSMTSSQSKTGDAGVTVSPGSVPVSSAIGPVSVGTQPPPKQGSFDSLQNSFTVQPVGGQTQGMQSFPKQNLQTLARNAPVVPPNNSAATQSQMQWPRLSQTDVQKYAKVFVEVDTDKDGKITGEQARHLFLSWRLPREVLKQVWDLSDQDNDSMLSLREFCIALYLMERYREGRPLPAVLPNSIMLDLPAIVQPAGGYGNAAWGHAPGMQHQQGVPGSGHANARPPARASGKPPLPVPAMPADDRMQPKPQKAKVPVLEKHLVDQLSEEEQKTLNAKFQEASEATKKVEELEKDIKESREKIEFYRVKMQELVLYKSRCDSRFNEITERAASDQREVELLAKKYEEKYRQTGDVASKLTLEEATFRDIQERKMELYQAVVKMEQDGNADDSLQVRADRIQSNLEELVHSMSERCKKYGLRAKPTTLLELPFGWQPGIQEGAADWDEDWDKFEDEGYTFVKELTLDVQNVIAPPKTKTKPVKKEKKSVYESEATAPADAETKSEKPADEQVSENGSVHNQSEVDQVTSPSSPAAKSMRGSPYGKSLDSHFGETVGSDASSQAKETHAQSDHEGAGSTFSVDRRSDEPAWGAFDSHDDADSVWGFGSSKELDAERRRDDLFGHGEWSLPPIKTSPLDGGIFKKKETSIFADSVPGTPFSSTFSPQKYGEGPDRPLNFSRFDSFGSTDSSFQTRETLARFDSIRSTKDSDYGLGFPSFDDSDPFGSGPFKSSLGSETPRRDLDPFGSVGPSRSSLGAETPRAYPDPFAPLVETPRRDSDHHFAYSGSFKSTIGSETPRTESDPFGFGGPFRSSFGGETPRRDSDFGGPFQSSFASDTPRSDFGGPFQSSFASDTPRSDFGGPFHSTFGTETPRSDFGGPFRSSFGAETPRSDFGGPFRSSSFGNETPRHELDPFGSTGPFKSSFSETPRSTNNWSAF